MKGMTIHNGVIVICVMVMFVMLASTQASYAASPYNASFMYSVNISAINTYDTMLYGHTQHYNITDVDGNLPDDCKGALYNGTTLVYYKINQTDADWCYITVNQTLGPLYTANYTFYYGNMSEATYSNGATMGYRPAYSVMTEDFIGAAYNTDNPWEARGSGNDFSMVGGGGIIGDSNEAMCINRSQGLGEFPEPYTDSAYEVRYEMWSADGNKYSGIGYQNISFSNWKIIDSRNMYGATVLYEEGGGPSTTAYYTSPSGSDETTGIDTATDHLKMHMMINSTAMHSWVDGISNQTGSNTAYIILDRFCVNQVDDNSGTFSVKYVYLGHPVHLITITGAEEGVPVESITVSITAPANATYLNNTIYYSTTIYSTFLGYTCYQRIDGGIETSLGNKANNTVLTGTIPVAEGGHDLNITCVNSTTSGTNQVFFSAVYSNVSSEQNQTNALETNYTQFYHTINTTSNVTNINASLMYNGTGTASTVTKQGNNYYIVSNVSVPLLAFGGNNTQMAWNLNYTLQGVGTTTNNGIGTQNVFIAYNMTSIAAPGDAVEGETITITSNLLKDLSLATLTNEVTYAGNTASGSLSGSAYTASMYLAKAYTMSNTSELRSNFYISHGERSRNVSIYQNLTLYWIYLGPCNATYPQAWLSFLGYDEYTPTNTVNYTLNVYMEGFSGDIARNFTANFTEVNTYNHTVCMYPATRSWLVNGTLDYDDAPTYGQRHYFLINTNVSNVSSNINLYMLNSTWDDMITFTVEDVAGTVQEDVIIKLQRWYTGTNTYRNVVMGLTGSDGKSVIRAQLYDAWYRIILERNGAVLRAFSTEELESTAMTLRLSSESPVGYWQYYDTIAYHCDANTTNYVVCTVTDTSNKMASATLKLQRFGATAWTTLCETTETGAAVTISCLMDTNITGKWYFYSLKMTTTDDDQVLLTQAYIGDAGASDYGALGLLITASIVLVLALLGAYNPAVSLTLGALGLIVSFMAGFMAVSVGALIGILVVLGIFIVKVKS